MATIYYSDATQPGQPAITGFGEQIVTFAFNFPTTIAASDQIALVWIPMNAAVTEWVLYVTIAFASTGSATIGLGNFRNNNTVYMSAQPSLGSLPIIYSSTGTGAGTSALYNEYTVIQTLTGYTNIPAEVADVFRLTVTALGTPTANGAVVGHVRYLL